MNRSKRIEPVVKIAEVRERDAAHMLGESQRRLKESEARLNELAGYRDEYARRFAAVAGQGLDVALMRDYRVFLERLNAAIDQQQRAVEAARRDCDAKRGQWLDTRRRAQSLNKVAENYRRQENYEQSRREQRESDERAQRSGAFKNEH